MRPLTFLLAAAASVAALTLNDICTVSYAQAALPAAGFYNGITIASSSLVTSIGANYSVSDNYFFSDAVINYCNISFAHTHNGRDDTVNVAYWVPEPSKFSSRYLATGAGGLSINSGADTVSGGVSIGAASGLRSVRWKDGCVVSRTDLCKLHFNLDTVIGTPYYYAASPESSYYIQVKRQSSSATLTQNRTVSAKGVEVAKTIMDGLHDLKGRRVYFSHQPSATFTDAETEYNSATGEWELSVRGLGAEFITRYIELLNTSTLANLDGVTYDTLRGWMYDLWQTYDDSFQTTWPDLTSSQDNSAKLIHIPENSDFSMPTASFVRYWESVFSIMFPGPIIQWKHRESPGLLPAH
ncbi:putative tannase and feruloyl esterase family protein [Phaeomoniella chlamydospora]|uniref:Carboxylic ester hydrolase n=1 Tax=Phaeomoniella chlamydospora TaxID=158046 RepID=A0A0G2EXW4_PHACM|nr:putative tannase and feruloyl esterase family protein [Phaeomoniella chlamydospora]